MSKRTAKPQKAANVSEPAPWPHLNEDPVNGTATAVTSQPAQQMPAEDVREYAYLLWEAAGQPPGDGVQFWYEAER